MKSTSLRLLLPVILSVFVGLPFVSCKHGNPVVDQSLDRIEQVVQQHPDSALLELIRLDSLITSGNVPLEGDAQHARYALLKTQTHDRNWIDETNDSLILRAVRYYDDHGSKREQMLAHYFHGCIWRNAKALGRAYASFFEAAQMADELNDYTFAGLSFGNISSICHEMYSGEDLLYAEKSYQCHQAAGDTARMNWALMLKGIALNYQKRYDEADTIFSNLLSSNIDERLRHEVLTYYIYQCVVKNQYQRADSLISLQTSPRYTIDYLCRAIVFENYGRHVEADSCMKYAEELSTSETEKVFELATLADLQNSRGKYQEAYQSLLRKSDLQDSIVRVINTTSVSSVQQDYVQQQLDTNNRLMRERTNRYRIVLVMSALLLLLAVVIVLQRLRQKDLLVRSYLDDVFQLRQELGMEQQRRQQSDISHSAAEAEANESTRKSRMTIRRLFKERMEKIDRIGLEYFSNGETKESLKLIYNEVQNEINAFKDQEFLAKLVKATDENFEGLMSKVQKDGLFTKDDDLHLLCLMIAGFSTKSTCLLMKVGNRDIIYKRRSRLKERILASDLAYKDDLLQLLA